MVAHIELSAENFPAESLNLACKWCEGAFVAAGDG